MQPSDELPDDLADAILEGRPVDWTVAESSPERARSPLLSQLKVVAAVAALVRSDDACAAPVLWGHLRLVERIGRGAFGEVYRAWDTRLDREVALKLLPADRPARERTACTIIHEGRLLARVRHPNVVTIYGAEQIGDRIGLWMEFVHGQTLEHILDERKVVSATEAIDIGLELCRAISAVHGAGLLHRDIKTHNVMRAEDGRIVLMDFGTGRELGDEGSSDLAGTPLYLAPEVLNGQPATIQSDLYSLGVLLYRLVTGSYPVQARTVREVRRAHERGERIAVPTRSGVRRNLARVIERAIDRNPARRYQSAGALGTDLQALEPRRTTARLAYAAGLAAACTLLATVAWEVTGRHLGFRTTPTAILLAAFNVGPGAVRPVEQPVIAVLPFTNLSAAPETEYFVEGLTDEIIRNLALVQGLQVRSRASSFALKDTPHDYQQIAKQLGVNLVVDGSVQRDGNRLRISAQLVQVEGDSLLWADRFDQELKAIFAVQDEISRAIVNRLGLTLGKGQRRYVNDLDAYKLYLQARSLVDRRGIPNAQKAAELFERVIAADPGFAPAHAGLAHAYAFASFPFRGIEFEAAYPTMRSAALKALQLDPLLAEAHVAMGWVYAYENDWMNAEAAFQRAIQLDPSLTQAYTSYSISTLQSLEKYDEALRLLREALRHDPLSLDVQREIGQVQLYSGRYAEAVETFQRAVQIEPEFPFVRSYLARALILADRVDEALQVLDPGLPFVGLGRAYVMTGRRAEAETLAAEWERYPFRLAIISAALGDSERAVEALERAAVSEPHRMGRLLIEPELVALRGDPRVAAIRKTLGLP